MRAIQAMAAQMAEERLDAAKERQELTQAILRVTQLCEGIAKEDGFALLMSAPQLSEDSAELRIR